jgi:hypothetical protein
MSEDPAFDRKMRLRQGPCTDDSAPILTYARPPRSRWRFWLRWGLPLLVLAYISGYVLYRNAGTSEAVSPCGGGPLQLLCSTETPARRFFYELFVPCVRIEQGWYDLTCHESRVPESEW